MRAWIGSLSLSLALATVALSAGEAHAQDQQAAILDTQLGEGVEEGSGGAVGRMLRAQLDGLGVVRTSSGVALDLAEVQLALGCVGETADCLRPVADELSVRFLLIPHLDRAGAELMLTVALFDRQEGTIDRVVRRAPSRSELLDSVEGALRELFDLPPPSVDRDTTPPPIDGDTEPPPDDGGLSPWPFVVMGVGAASIGVGVGFAVAFSDAQSEWETADPQTEMEVDAARDALGRAETYAIVADVLFAVGGAAVAGGLAWMLVELLTGSEDPGDVSLAPMIGPTTVGVAAEGRWEVQ